METANQILSTFLLQQRSKANLELNDVALLLERTAEQIETWEKRPVKAPLCEIAKLVQLCPVSNSNRETDQSISSC